MIGEVFHPVPSESIAYAIAALVQAHDPELVRRYLELHRERLEERLADQQRILDLLERLLTAAWSGSALDTNDEVDAYERPACRKAFRGKGESC